MRLALYRLFIYAVISFIFSLTACAQASFHFRHLGPEDGAPSSKIYDFAQDSEGVIWIGTDQGLSAYDGTQFRTYTAADGLPNSMIVSLEVDAHDRLWANAMGQPVVYFEQERAHALSNLEDFKRKDLSTHYASGDSVLWLNMMKKGSRQVDAPLTYLDMNKKIHSVANTQSTQFGHPIIHGDTSIFFYGHEKEIIYIHKGQVVKRVPHQIQQTIQVCKDWEGNFLCITSPRPSYLGETNFELYQLNPQTGEAAPVLSAFADYFAEDNLTNLHVDHAENIWLCLRNGLLLLRKMENNQYQAYRLLEGVSVNFIFQDRQHNYWLGTNGEGIYFLPSLQVQYWQSPPVLGRGSIMTVSGEADGDIWIGYATGYLEQLNPDLNLGYSQKIAARRIIDILEDNDQQWIASNSILFSYSDEQKLKKHGRVKESLKRIKLIDDALYLFSRSIYRLQQDSLQALFQTENDRIYAAAGTADHMYVGTTEGLYTYTPDAPDPYQRIVPEVRTNIREIISVGEDVYWVATQGFGIIMLKNGKLSGQIREADGLASNICNDILLTDQYIWVATNQGVSRINRKNAQILNFSTKDGLSSNEINFVTKAGNKIVAATSRGLNIFSADIQPDREAPKLHFKKLLVNNQTRALSDTLQLRFRENAIQLEYIGISYRSTTSIEYAYQLDGLDQDWLYTSANTLNWSAIPPGDYRLRLKARGNHTDWSEEQSIIVSVAYPWWQTIWFYVAAVCGILFFFGSLIWIIQDKNRRERRQMRFQLAALRAQMNPHFMFNILNSVQDFIYQNDKFSANQYLAKFAGLMRGILQESSKEEIVLQAEIKQLQLYLDLEKLRFKDSFTAQIQCATDVHPAEVIIPGMLIQPFVENAIKHGLFHLKGEKRLQINFRYLSEHLLECVIDDNGIGRAAAAIIRDKQNIPHNAKATLLTEERLQVLTYLQRKRFSLNIEDKIDPRTQESLGTRVILHIPYKIY